MAVVTSTMPHASKCRHQQQQRLPRGHPSTHPLVLVCVCVPCAGKIHWRNTKDQLQLVGPKSLGVALLTAGFVGMVFTIQVSTQQHRTPLTAAV